MKFVLLPGLDGTGLLSLQIEEALTPEHSVSTFSYPPNLCGYEELLERIEEELPSEDFIIVAESFAGPLAAKIGSKNLPQIKGIVFVATFAQRPRRFPAFFAYMIRIVPIKSAFISRMAQPLLMGRWSNRKFTDAFSQALSKVPAATLSGRLLEVLKTNVVSELAKINKPILYLRATKDCLVPACMSNDFAIASGNVCHIEGPHFLLQANATDAAIEILKFAACVD